MRHILFTFKLPTFLSIFFKKREGESQFVDNSVEVGPEGNK
jgi:hypothetical protein